jgi:hypothetical protein
MLLSIDYDALTNEEAIRALRWADSEYRLAFPEVQVEMWESLQEAWDRYLAARVNWLKPGMICTDKDVILMKQIRREICQAADTQTLIQGLIKLARFFLKF